MVYAGPVRPGYSEEVFRKTGRSVPALPGEPGFYGPVRPPSRGGPGTGISRAQAEAFTRAETQRLAEKQARIKAELEAKRKAEEQAKRERQQAIARADSKARVRAETKVRQIQEEKGKLEKTSIQIQQIRKQLRERRGPITPTKFLREMIKPPPEKQILLGATIGGVVLENIIAWKDLPKTAKAIVQNPEILASIPSAVKRGVIDFGRLIKVSPTEAFVKIGTEIILLKGTAKAFSGAGKLTGRASARISPKFVGKAKVGKTLQVTTKSGREINLKVVGRIGSKSLPRDPIKKQVLRAGQKALPVSSQSDELVGFIKRKRLIRKPLLNEAKFTKPTKKLLSKFDGGKINKKELTKLDKLIQKQSGKGILERSFFADPEARIRPSRLGVEKEASIIDVIRGDVTFKKQKPQILVFDKVRVEKFPKNFKKIKNKLATGKSLTKSEADKLLQFQLKTSGKFKPLGFLSGEAELTLAPKEIIKRGKKIGVTIINKRKVPIFETKVLKPSKKLTKSISLARKGKLNKKQLKALDKTLKKKTGFNFGLSRPKKSVKRISIKRIGATTISRAPKRKPRISKIPSRPRKISRIKRPSRPIRKPSKPSKPSRPSRPRKPSKPSKVSRPSKPSRPLRPRKPSKPSKPGRPARIKRPLKPKKVIRITKIKKKKKKLKKKISYNVYGKRLKKKKGKVVWIKLNTKPLTKTHAQNRGAYAIDHSVARTFKIRRVRKVKRVGKITKREGKYFKKTKKKYRPYKIKKGVKKPIVRKYIERKGKYLIDTRGEKRGLKLSRIAKQLKGRPLKRVVKRKSITTKFKKSKVFKKGVALGNKGGRVAGGRGKISKPKRFVKGSKEAKDFMAKLRSMKRR